MAPDPKRTQAGTVESEKTKAQQQKVLESPEYTEHIRSKSPSSHVQERQTTKDKTAWHTGLRYQVTPSFENEAPTESSDDNNSTEDHQDPSPNNEDKHREQGYEVERETWLEEDSEDIDPFDTSPQESRYWRNNSWTGDQ